MSNLFGVSGGDVEEKCQQNLKIAFCNDIIFHSVSEEVHERKNEPTHRADEWADEYQNSYLLSSPKFRTQLSSSPSDSEP